jgi:hypothetical protein
MRLALLTGCLLVATLGCAGERWGRSSTACAPDDCSSSGNILHRHKECVVAEEPCGGPPCSPCPPPVCQPGPQPVCQAPPPPPPPEKAPPPPVRAPQPPETVENRVTTTAVTQDILLIPRTVYVPYAPHVPVAPARLSMCTPAAHVVQTEERYREQVQAPPETTSRDTQINNALDQCLQQMRMLNQRIGDLEKRAAPAVAPCPAPQVPGPCDYGPNSWPGCQPTPDCGPDQRIRVPSGSDGSSTPPRMNAPN